MSVPKLDKLPEPRNLGAVRAKVERRWGTIDLLDILKDTAFITGFTGSFASVASREVLDRTTLNRRLLLVLFALGTNMGIRRRIGRQLNKGENAHSLKRPALTGRRTRLSSWPAVRRASPGNHPAPVCRGLRTSVQTTSESDRRPALAQPLRSAGP